MGRVKLFSAFNLDLHTPQADRLGLADFVAAPLQFQRQTDQPQLRFSQVLKVHCEGKDDIFLDCLYLNVLPLTGQLITGMMVVKLAAAHVPVFYVERLVMRLRAVQMEPTHISGLDQPGQQAWIVLRADFYVLSAFLFNAAYGGIADLHLAGKRPSRLFILALGRCPKQTAADTQPRALSRAVEFTLFTPQFRIEQWGMAEGDCGTAVPVAL
ncbi:MAG: hypothetical protein DDT39_01572 [Firmicutes bacterium]|nr:hypothetical protein [candidate division NPL-UPA2 bacterium]